MGPMQISESVDPHFCDGSYLSQSVDPQSSVMLVLYKAVSGPQILRWVPYKSVNPMSSVMLVLYAYTNSQWTLTSVMGPIQVSQWTHAQFSDVGPIYKTVSGPTLL